MLAIERQNYILKKLDENGVVYLTKLTQELNASICTIRRDFDKLESENKCKRIHGGAVKVQHILEDTDIHMKQRMTMNPEEKNALCKKCAELIQDGDCIFVDGGTTFMYLMNYIHDKKVTIVSHSDYIHAIEDPNCTVIKLGGENSIKYQMNLGTLVMDYLENFHFNKAFISAVGITLDDLNIYTAELETAKVKKMAIQRSNQVYFVADSSKIGVSGFYTLTNLNSIYGLVTSSKDLQLETNAKIFYVD